jgi:uncharacterized membrane protein
MDNPTEKLIEVATFVFVAIILIWVLWITAEDAIKEIPHSVLIGIIIALVVGFAYFAQNKFKEMIRLKTKELTH